MADERKPETKTTVTETSTVKPNEDGATAYPNGKSKFSPLWFLILLVPLLLWLMITHRNNDTTSTNTNNTAVTSGAHHDAQTGTTLAAAPLARDAAAGVPGSDGSMAGVPDSAGSAGDAANGTATTTSAMPVAGSGSGSDATGTGAGKDTKVFSGKDIATGGTAAASSKGEPLSDVTEFSKATDRLALVGRKVKLTDVNVQRVLTDRAYFVGAGDSAAMLVLLDKDMDAGAGPQRVKIMPGHKVSLTGVLEPVPTAEIANEQYGLGKPNYDAIGKEQVYLHVTVAQKK